MKTCPYCGQTLQNHKVKKSWSKRLLGWSGETSTTYFESSLPFQGNAQDWQVVQAPQQPKTASSNFDTLVRVPLAQSIGWGVFWGLPLGVAVALVVRVDPQVARYFPWWATMLMGFCIFTGWKWGQLTGFFNDLLLPDPVDPIEAPQSQPAINVMVTGEDRVVRSGGLTADSQAVIWWAERIMAQMSAGVRKDKVKLSWPNFSDGPFSQPSFQSFMKELLALGVVKKKNPNVENSAYILTGPGVSFASQWYRKGENYEG